MFICHLPREHSWGPHPPEREGEKGVNVGAYTREAFAPAMNIRWYQSRKICDPNDEAQHIPAALDRR